MALKDSQHSEDRTGNIIRRLLCHYVDNPEMFFTS